MLLIHSVWCTINCVLEKLLVLPVFEILIIIPSSIEHEGTSAIYIFMAPLTLFNEAPKHKSVAPMALKNAFLWLSWPSLMRGYHSCRLWHGSRGVILKNRKISINYWFLRPYTHKLVRMQILQT